MKRDDPRHGTENGYNNLDCRCQRCRDAHAAITLIYKERRRAKLAAGAGPKRIHGTAGGYGNWGCRCRPCTRAWSAAMRAAYHRRRQAS